MTELTAANPSRTIKLLIPFIVIAVRLIVWYLMATKPTPPKTEIQEQEWLVAVEQIHLGTATPQLELLGKVESPFDSTLSAAISAEVLKVPMREGQAVVQGDLLIELDAQEINLAIRQRQADVDELKALIDAEQNRYQADLAALAEEQKLLDLAVSAVTRQAKLQESQLAAQERFEQAEAQRAQKALSVRARELTIADHPSRLGQLQARLSRASAALQDALFDAEHSKIKAPFKGLITAIKVAPGERVMVGQALASLYDDQNMEVRAQIPDSQVETIKNALARQAVIEAQSLSYGHPIRFYLKRLSGQTNSGTGGMDALFTPIDNSGDPSGPSGLVLNSSLKLKVDLPPLADVATLPTSAIYGSDQIYRIEAGRLQALKVNILGRQFSDQGSDRVVLSSKTLNAGDTVIVTQLPNAISGLKVKPRAE